MNERGLERAYHRTGLVVDRVQWTKAIWNMHTFLNSKELAYWEAKIAAAASNSKKRWLFDNHMAHSRSDYCNSVLVRLPWSLVQQLQSVMNSAARLIFGLKCFDHITPALMDLHWLPYNQLVTYKLCMIMFKCLRGSAPAYLADYCTSTSLVPGRSA